MPQKVLPVITAHAFRIQNALNLDYADENRRRRLEHFVRACGIAVLVPLFR